MVNGKEQWDDLRGADATPPPLAGAAILVRADNPTRDRYLGSYQQTYPRQSGKTRSMSMRKG